MIASHKVCLHCGATDIPVGFDFCGRCGKPFAPSTLVTDATIVNDILNESPEAMEVLEEHGICICGGCIILLNSSAHDTAEYSGLSATEALALVEELNDKLHAGHRESSA